MEERILAALRGRAVSGACRIEDFQALANELHISKGKLKAELMRLCGEGKILWEGSIILLFV